MQQVGDIETKEGKALCENCGAEFECMFLNGRTFVFFCDSCHEKRLEQWEENERQAAKFERERQVQANLEQFRKIVPPKKWKLDPNLFPSDIETARNCVRMVAKGKNVLIHGESRSGKSVTAWQCCKSWINKGGAVTVLKDVEFNRLIEKSYRDSHFNHDDLIRSFLSDSLLFIDDLGKAKVTERVEADLFNIIDHRTEYELPTLITSQFVGETFQRRLETPETAVAIDRRIREFFEIIHLK